MHGKNKVTTRFHDRTTLMVNEIWPTIQGEGPDAGRVSVFVRLSKCNLRCHFCDTEFENGEVMSHHVVARRVVEVAKYCHARLAVLTGGEPLLQNVVPLVRECNNLGLAVSIETAGTVYCPGLDNFFVGGNRRYNGNMIVCSPKTPGISKDLIPLIGAYKYIIRAHEIAEEDGLPLGSTQKQGIISRVFRAPKGSTIYVQPCDEGDEVKNKANLNAATLSCMRFGYRLSIQVHKIAGMP